jgi:hypothetical protein
MQIVKKKELKFNYGNTTINSKSKKKIEISRSRGKGGYMHVGFRERHSVCSSEGRYSTSVLH